MCGNDILSILDARKVGLFFLFSARKNEAVCIVREPGSRSKIHQIPFLTPDLVFFGEDFSCHFFWG